LRPGVLKSRRAERKDLGFDLVPAFPGEEVLERDDQRWVVGESPFAPDAAR
jgi:hypothetical protein